MSCKISLISLIKEQSVFVQHAQNRVAGSVAGLCPDTGRFETFTDTKEMLKALSASFSRSKVVMVCADRARYLYLKKLIFQALSLESEVSGAVTAAIQGIGEDAFAETADAHAFVPKGASVFVSDDGLFSGFAVRSGKQHLVVLPLDLERLDSIIENGFAAYMNTAVAAQGMPAASSADSDNAAAIAARLIAQGFCAAIAATKSAELIKIKITPVSGWEKAFRFIDCDEDKKEMTQKEYLANLALQARDRAGCSVGAAISNVFTGDKADESLFVLVTIADSIRARVAKVYAQPGETPRQLAMAAVDTLLGMIGEYAEADGFTGFPMNTEEPEMPAEELKGKRRIALKLIISGIAAVILCLIIIFFGGRMVSAVKDFSGRLRNADQTQTVNALTDTSAEAESSKPSIDELLIMLADMPSYTSEENEITGISDSTQSTSAAVQSAVVSTAKPSLATTAKPPATSAKTTSTASVTSSLPPTTPAPASTVPPQLSGTFAFTVKGYGHGVGMSQRGAIAYANQGWSYDKILLHYYQPGVIIINDPNPPSSVSYDGTPYPLQEFLARTIAQEIGPGSPIEALKAQAVAAYTYAKVRNFTVTSSQSAFSTSFNMDPASNVVKAATAVAGKYLSYNGNPINAFYFASCAGQTVSSASVWGGSLPYLGGGVASPETVAISYESYKVSEFKAFVDSYNLTCGDAKKITLQENPAEWIKIVSTDSAGYVNTIKVGDREMRGYAFRQNLLKLDIDSHSFSFTYAP